MNLFGYHAFVFRASFIFLVCILAFGVIFSLLPSGGSTVQSGVTLRGVKFNLYPEQDQGAVWRFQAKQLSFDPLKRENTLDDLGRGERWLTPKDGPERLDMTLNAQKLVIDGDDNLRAQRARMYIIDGCYTLDFKASGDKPVLIDQRAGYSAPSVEISSPSINIGFDNFSAPFDLGAATQGDVRPGSSLGSHPDSACVNGKVVSRPT